MVPGDLTDAAHCRAVIDRAVQELGKVDILVSNAAFQATHQDLTEISDEEWDLHASHQPVLTCSAYARPPCRTCLRAGLIIGTTSRNSPHTVA